jgi:hypothetical protein
MRQTLLINRDSFISVDSGLGSVDTRRTSINARRNSGLQQQGMMRERRLSMVTDASRGTDTDTTSTSLGSGEDNADHWQKQLAAAQAEYLRDEAALRGKLNTNPNHPPVSEDLELHKFDDDPFQTPGNEQGDEFDVVILSDEDDDDEDEDEEDGAEEISNNRSLSLGEEHHLQLPDIDADRISPLPATVYINPTIILSPAPSPLPTPPETPLMDAGDIRNLMVSGDASELIVASVELVEQARNSEMYSEILAMDILCSPNTSIMWKPIPVNIPSGTSTSLLWSPSSSASQLKSRGSGLTPAAVATRPNRKRTGLEFHAMILESNKLWQKAPRRATDTQVKRTGGLWRDPNFRPKSILARDGSVKRSGSRRRVTFRVGDDEAVPVPVLPGMVGVNKVNTGGDVMG